ncbi:MAG: hypothetical protein ACPHAR_04015, partial [Flavobacteriaceae bacterium]
MHDHLVPRGAWIEFEEKLERRYRAFFRVDASDEPSEVIGYYTKTRRVVFGEPSYQRRHFGPKCAIHGRQCTTRLYRVQKVLLGRAHPVHDHPKQQRIGEHTHSRVHRWSNCG